VSRPPEPSPSLDQGRRAELTRNLAAITARVGAACAAAERAVSEVTLIAVTKTRPASDVVALAALGLTDFGENRDQEAAAKVAEVAEAAPVTGAGVLVSAAPATITWHFIGQLQTNKASSVAGYANVVHSVDRVRLVRALGAAAREARPARAGRPLTCLVQVSLDGDPARGGVPLSAFSQVAEAIEAEDGLTLGGVMAVAPLGLTAEKAFAPLRAISAQARAVNPAATMISAGMSGDLEAAVHHGATHLRIGTALLGDRTPPVL
jgi:pyridoxal phosphate enzyme (YggS family)